MVERWIDEKIRQAVKPKQVYEKKEIEWKITYCPRCQSKIQYSPSMNFKGKLRCNHCGYEFLVPSLDKYLE